MKRFISLRVEALKLDNLAGLCDETIAVAVPKSPSLGTLGNVRMNNLDAANKKLKLLLNQQHASALTPKIKEADRQRDTTPVTAEAEADETALRADDVGSLRATTPQTHQLSLGKDFSVTYKNNTHVGTAEVTIHGKGAYKGQKTVTFNITRV
jgi:hypothetical protein